MPREARGVTISLTELRRELARLGLALDTSRGTLPIRTVRNRSPRVGPVVRTAALDAAAR